MNFAQLQERLRLEVLRRIEREVLTASLLARKTGLQQPTISNFLRNKRRLSSSALDRVLAALELDLADFFVVPATQPDSTYFNVPLVSAQVAMHDDLIRPSSISSHVPCPAYVLTALRLLPGSRHSARERFVAVGLTPAQTIHMQPRLLPNVIVVLDRHAVTPLDSNAGNPPIYAVRLRGQLHFCFLSFTRDHFVLRSCDSRFASEYLPVPPGVAPSELVTGRVCFTAQGG